MKDINQVIKHSQIGSENRPKEQCKQWSQEAEKLVLGIFARFGDLFQSKCKASGVIIYDADDKYTETFKLWCLKLHRAGITVEDVQRGIKHLEEHVRDSVRSDNEVWPPSYAEMIGHCQKQKKREFWKGLPAPKMTDEQRKEKMKKLRGSIGL